MRIGPMEIIIVLVIIIAIFGIAKLPDIGKSLGEGLRSFKKAQDEVDAEVKSIKATVEGKPVEPAKPVEGAKPDSDTETPKTPPAPLPPPNDEE